MDMTIALIVGLVILAIFIPSKRKTAKKQKGSSKDTALTYEEIAIMDILDDD